MTSLIGNIQYCNRHAEERLTLWNIPLWWSIHFSYFEKIYTNKNSQPNKAGYFFKLLGYN